MPHDTPALLLTALRLWDDRGKPQPGAVNMAMDEALLTESMRTGEPVLRIYRWDRPTLSFGYFMPLPKIEMARRAGESLVRRWTGGGVVHHEGAVTWSLVAPRGESFWQVRPAESYAALHGALARCLTEAGLEGISVVPTAMAAPAGGLCVEAQAPGDLLQKGRKIAGAGQRRTRQGLLHQGVVFLPETELPTDFPQRLAAALTETISDFSLPAEWILPTARYEDPAWNARR